MGKKGGGRKSYEASTAQDCEFSTLSEQKPKKNLAPALTRRGARDFGFAKARVNQSNGQVTFSGVLPPCLKEPWRSATRPPRPS